MRTEKYSEALTHFKTSPPRLLFPIFRLIAETPLQYEILVLFISLSSSVVLFLNDDIISTTQNFSKLGQVGSFFGLSAEIPGSPDVQYVLSFIFFSLAVFHIFILKYEVKRVWRRRVMLFKIFWSSLVVGCVYSSPPLFGIGDAFYTVYFLASLLGWLQLLFGRPYSMRM